MARSRLFGYAVDEDEGKLLITIDGMLAENCIRQIRDSAQIGRGREMLAQLLPVGSLYKLMSGEAKSQEEPLTLEQVLGQINPGMRDGRKAAQAVGAFLVAPDFGSNRPEDVSDFNDLHQCAGLDAVCACIEKAAPFNGLGAGAAAESEPCEIDREIARLAKLRAVDYERERKDAAAKLGMQQMKRPFGNANKSG
jgi:hypothetical protein